MSGHSKWSTIKRQKGTADVKRGQAFTKLANVITIAVKSGGSGSPDDNPRLRTVLEEAKSLNMPKDNIQRAIDRGLAPLRQGSVGLEEVIYEGFGPGKVAFYLEGITDNKLRTLQEIKSLFEKSGGNLGGQGSVAYMFDKKGEISVKRKGESNEEEILELIDLGAEDVEDKQDYLVYVQSSELNTMSTKITQAGFEVESAEIVMKPKILQKIDNPELAKKVMEFMEKLEDNPDIQRVYANCDMPEEFL